jgi:uncharacterized membrane protein YdfJ with MMPL/SSD domain
MIVVISITSIIMSSAAMIFSHGSNGYFTAQQLNGLSIEAEQTIQQLSKELRMARSINGISAPQLNFTDQSGQAVSYSLSDTELQRSQDGGTTSFASSNHTASFAITYFDGDLATTSVAENVRLVNITLNFVDGENTMQFVQSTYLRSLI